MVKWDLVSQICIEAHMYSRWFNACCISQLHTHTHTHTHTRAPPPSPTHTHTDTKQSIFILNSWHAVYSVRKSKICVFMTNSIWRMAQTCVP